MNEKYYPVTLFKHYFFYRIIAVCLTTLFILSGVAVSAEVVDRIVAIVNNDIIRLVELNKAVAPVAAQIRSKGYSPEREQKEIYKARMDVLNNLIDEKLADQEIRDAGIFVDEREINSAIEQVKAMNYYSDEDLRAALKTSGISMEEYRKEIKKQILRNKLVNLRVKSKIIITDTDVKNYYESHPEKYASQQKYRLSNILMAYPISTDSQSRKAVYSKMEEVHKILEGGASFADTAKKYSQASNASDGGKLGQFAIGDLSKNIQKVISGLKGGEISLITETDQGLQIFYVESIENTGGKALSDVTDEIRQQLYQKEVNDKFQSWIDNLRKDANIQIIS